MKKNPKYQTKHLSIRVPWHDNKWNGTVCNEPRLNNACLILKSCALKRNDDVEEKNKGSLINKLKENEQPICMVERGAFMSPVKIERHAEHPYSETSKETHGNLLPTLVSFPPYSAPSIPYYWMRKQFTEELAERYNLMYDSSKEPQLKFKDSWVQALHNQKELLNCFYEHLEIGQSLVFFYAKQVPFVEEGGRVLVGVGRIKHIKESEEYDYKEDNDFRCCYWDHIVQHTIRPECEDGFLLPYHEAIEFNKENPDFDPASIAVVIPNEKRFEFSYASEHVSHDSAIKVLLLCLQSIKKCQKIGIKCQYLKIEQWIHDEIHKIEKLRGDYPGMGAALCAFGIDQGHFVAAEIINKITETENPWDFFSDALETGGLLSKETAELIPVNIKKKYLTFKKREKKMRINLLFLLSRFDISKEQATAIYVEEERARFGIKLTDEDFLLNPYLLYEGTVNTHNPISLDTVDMGLFKKSKCSKQYPEGLVYPDEKDERRIRAYTIAQLENAAIYGHTLLPRKHIVNQIRDLSIKPKCNLDGDLYDIISSFLLDNKPSFAGIVSAEMKDGSPAYKLTRLRDVKDKIIEKVIQRKNADPLDIKENWDNLLKEELNAFKSHNLDERERLARQEKTAALEILATSRISVLIGPAGTGKTTLLKVLVKNPEVNKGCIFLAPTGKARVRMEEVCRGMNIPAYTVAQFLSPLGRYDNDLCIYKLSDQKCESKYETVILDEASMLTETMLATLMDSFKSVKRFILVGDHRQLPPIGEGRPFIDIINFLKPEGIDAEFPKTGKCYAELTIKRRFEGIGRDDLILADWFSGNPMEPGEDSIINDILQNKKSQFLKLIKWENEGGFENTFKSALIEELGLSKDHPHIDLNVSLGSTDDGFYFNSTRDADHFGIKASVDSVESWQILSPVREKKFGVRSLNRLIHKTYRQYCVDFARKNFVIPKPFGAEEIVYGDKVMNLMNTRVKDKWVYPKDGINYIANGEIGVVTGQYKRNKFAFKGRPQYMEVEFSSQKGYVYTFFESQVSEDSDVQLELAYAITVHKAQGSEFEKVFLVIPNPCFLLSREMLYTALTRQKERVIVLYQGDLLKILETSSTYHSEAAKRITDLFEKPILVEHKGKYLEEHLIQMATDGTMLRSKSELLVYQRLLDKGLDPAYEKPLEIKEVIKLPDFTIENDDTGKMYYWEHCGLLHDPDYRARWEEKLNWYKQNAILPLEEGGGKAGTLIVSKDTPHYIDGETKGAISYMEIDELIQRAFNK